MKDDNLVKDQRSVLDEPDEYESHMTEAGQAIYRQKMTMPWFMGAFFGLIFMLTVAMVLATAAPWWPFLLQMGLLAVIAALFYALRVSVTEDHVYLQYGLLGPKIKVEDIVLCEAETYKVWRYGGYGIRYSITEGSWAFNMMGDKGKAVRIHYKSKYALGGVRKVVVSSGHPNVLADAINRARAAKGHALPDLSDEALGIDDEIDAIGGGEATLPEGLLSEEEVVETDEVVTR